MNVAIPSQINHISLCAGAGGIDLGLRIALADRIRTVCYVERESYAAAVIVARMESAALDEAPVWDDVASFDGGAWRGVVDLISAGFPCQPWSVAGKRAGQTDERWIWPHIARIIDEAKPQFVFLENVPGLLVRGGVNTVVEELAALGYKVQRPLLLSASDVGASQGRERVYILGYSAEFRQQGLPPIAGIVRSSETNWWLQESERGSGVVANSEQYGCNGWPRKQGRRSPSGIIVEGSSERMARPESANGRREQSTSIEERGWSGPIAGRTSNERRRNDSEFRESSNSQPGEAFQRERPGRAVDHSSIPIHPPGPNELERWREVLNESGILTPANSSVDLEVVRTELARALRSSVPGINRRARRAAARRTANHLVRYIPTKALEPAVCGMADELAYRVDRLRLCGNGVVPLAAAVAFRVLCHRVGIIF